MRWSTAEVAKMTKVSARTLRHYDAIGLLTPDHVGAGGLRFYTSPQLLRLQHILLLRRLGLTLGDIADIVEGDVDEIETLHRHAHHLADEKHRLNQLAATVDSTIKQLEGKQPMSPQQWFTGLSDEAKTEYDAEARRRWGDEAIDQSHEAISALNESERHSLGQQWEALCHSFANAIDAGHKPDSDNVTQLVEQHYGFVGTTWGRSPSNDAYAGLADLYVDDPRYRATFDQIHPRLATFVRDAMKLYIHRAT